MVETLPRPVTASGLVGSTVRVTAAGIVAPAGTLTASGLPTGELEADEPSTPPRPLRPFWPSLVAPPLRRRFE